MNKPPMPHPGPPYQGNTDEWWIPKYIFDAIGLEYYLDPAFPEDVEPWFPVMHTYDWIDDGLSKEWHGRVWLNPPYGKETGLWLNRLAEHGNGIALIFSRTDVKWWHEAVPKATGICFIKGRITFKAGKGQKVTSNSGAPSVLIAYGDDNARAIRDSGLGMYLNVRGNL